MEIDWPKAPEGAEFYAEKKFRKIGNDNYPDYWSGGSWFPAGFTLQECKDATDYAERPKEWPTDERISAIAQNGGDGLHYAKPPKTSAEYLSECLRVQTERGKQYDASGTGERSFAAAAAAFNAVRGKDLTGSDICLVLEFVKLVRQYSQDDRLHADSVLDKVSYSALWAEELTKELSE